MSQFSRVEFKTRSGVTLRGDFFKADQPNAPIVVLTSGFSLLKEMTHGAAIKFQEAGFSALAYDNQSFGSSDGLPRQEVNIYRQADDYHDAITAAMDLPGVDRTKIVMWGIGHGGSAAMIAAGRDPRIAGVILHAAFPSGTIDTSLFPEGLLDRAWKEREAMARNPNTPVSYAKTFRDWEKDSDGDDAQVFIKGIAAYYLSFGNKSLGDAANTPWENQVTLQSFINVGSTEAHTFADKIYQPALYMVNENDPFNAPPDVHSKIVARMGSNVNYQVIASPSSGDLGEQLGVGFDAQVKWLNQLFNR